MLHGFPSPRQKIVCGQANRHRDKKTRHTMWSSENLENSSWDSMAENGNKKFGEFVSFLKEAYSFLSVLSGAGLVIPFSIIIL